MTFSEYKLYKSINSWQNFAKCPWVTKAELSNSEAVGSRDFVNIQDTENCEAESDVCYLSSVKVYILVALSFTR